MNHPEIHHPESIAVPDKSSLASSLDDESGQGMVEYALILVLIAIVVIVVLTLLGGQVQNVFSTITAGLGT